MPDPENHYSDVAMGVMAFQIANISFVWGGGVGGDVTLNDKGKTIHTKPHKNGMKREPGA